MSTAGDPGNFYIWRASDDFAIHLSIQVVTQLNAQISRAGVQTKASTLRGILLGRVTEEPFRVTIIEDLQLLPSSDNPDADYSDEDALFEMACLNARTTGDRRVLGFFRCRRDGRLNMSPRDVETFSRLFSETGNVALLIQTSRRGNESDAALFYWDRGGAHPRDFGFGFPFDAGQLVSGHPGWRYPDPLAVSPNTPALDRPEPQEPEGIAPPESSTAWHVPADPPSGGREIRWSRLVPTVVIAVVAVAVMQLVSKKTVSAATVHPAAIESPAPAEPASAPAPAPIAPPHGDGLGLRVTLAPHQVQIRWNRDSQIIGSADRAVMKITETGITESVLFDHSELRDGYVAYIPKTNDVSVRLEVTAKDGATTVESIRSVAIP